MGGNGWITDINEGKRLAPGQNRRRFLWLYFGSATMIFWAQVVLAVTTLLCWLAVQQGLPLWAWIMALAVVNIGVPVMLALNRLRSLRYRRETESARWFTVRFHPVIAPIILFRIILLSLYRWARLPEWELNEHRTKRR